MIERALAIILTGGVCVSSPPATASAEASRSTISRSGDQLALAEYLSVHSGEARYVVQAPIDQEDLLNLLNDWIENDPVIADPDYDSQKKDLEENSLNFGVS